MSRQGDWIATLEDGTEHALAQTARKRTYSIEAPPVQIVEWRREGEPSRTQLLAALEAAEAYLAEEVDCMDEDHVEHAASALALVMAALGKLVTP